MDERKALRALQRGDERALEWFMDRYTGYVYAIISHITGAYLPPADAEEIASDVFLAFWNNAGRVRTGKAKAYLSATARNMAKDALRRLGQELPLEEDFLPLTGPGPEGEAERREQARLVRQALLSMGSSDREIFLRHYYYGQTLALIGEEMGMNVSTVKTRLRRGREKLREQLLQGGYFREDI